MRLLPRYPLLGTVIHPQRAVLGYDPTVNALKCQIGERCGLGMRKSGQASTPPPAIPPGTEFKFCPLAELGQARLQP
jgi:hypothetical protein